MNIEQAKAIAIAEILEKLELKPCKENGTDATISDLALNDLRLQVVGLTAIPGRKRVR